MFSQSVKFGNMKYSIFEISGRQYTIEPGQIIEVDKLTSAEGTLSIDKVLLMVDGDKIEVGDPYLKTKLELEVLGNQKGKKVRVAFYSPKANSRTVKGARRVMTKLKMAGTEVKKIKKSPKSDIKEEEEVTK